MERFIRPKNKKKFVSWLLGISNTNSWTIVLEYPNGMVYNVLKENATIVNLPNTAQHHYNSKYRLTSIKNPVITESFVNALLAETSALSIHNEEEMLFLIADDFHEECFSSTLKFFNVHHRILNTLDLIFVN